MTLLLAFLLLVAMPFAPSSVLVTTSKALVPGSDALVPSSVLAPRAATRSRIPCKCVRNNVKMSPADWTFSGSACKELQERSIGHGFPSRCCNAVWKCEHNLCGKQGSCNAQMHVAKPSAVVCN